MQENRWTIDELLARYDLEPELCDIFVEGSFDREILSHHLMAKGLKQAFYEIDVVDVPPPLLTQLGLTSGNKQRVIALSQELMQVSPNAKVFCLVDRDLDHWFSELENSARLRWSSYCSIEGHFLSTDTTRDIVMITSRSKIVDFEKYFASLLNVLRQMFALRLADRELDLQLKWVAIRKYLSTNCGTINFDIDKYTNAILNSNSAMKNRKSFNEKTKEWQAKLICDIRLAFRGHDYTELLAWSISEFNGHKEFSTTTAIERLFVLLARSVPTLTQEVK